MNWLQLPWTEVAIFTPILGGLIVTLIPNIELAGKWTFSVTLLTLVATLLALVAVHNTVPDPGLDLCGNWFGRCIFRLDTFSAPLLPMVAILHVLTVLATSQVIVLAEPPTYETAVLGEVTTNGPLLPSTVSTEVAELIPPVPA